MGVFVFVDLSVECCFSFVVEIVFEVGVSWFMGFRLFCFGIGKILFFFFLCCIGGGRLEEEFLEMG